MMHRLLFVWCLLVVSGCTTYNGLKPVYPPAGQGSATVVESMQPTLRWEADRDPSAMYDLKIVEGILSVAGVWNASWDAGRMVYHREGLREPQHQVETPLDSSGLYLWSVRSRRSDGSVSVWSTYNHYFGFAVPGASSFALSCHQPFRFRTPE